MTMTGRANARDKVVVVTGGSSGVGRAIVRRFAKAGAAVAVIARGEAALEETRLEIEAAGARGFTVSADVADPQKMFSAARSIEAALGPIDIWINNAMVTVFSPVARMNAEEFRRVTDVTYLGYVHGTMAALEGMSRRNRGTIVQIGSALAYRGIPLQSAYCGAKHAIRGFTDSLRTELLHDGSRIRLTMVQLPAVDTTQFDWARTHMQNEPRPVPPVMTPASIAEEVFHAAFSGSREVWIGASTLKVIFGNFAAPALVDLLLARTGYGSQARPDAVGPGRRDNLMRPADGHAAEGSFGKEAREPRLVLSETFARTALLALGLGVAGLAGGMLARMRGRRHGLRHRSSR